MSTAALAGRLQAAHGLLRKGDVAGADREVRGLLAAHPDSGPVLHLMGLVQRAGGDLPAARKSLESAIGKGANQPEVRNSLGNILADLGDLDAADRQFGEAIASDPDYQPAWINRGRLASRRARHAEAVKMLERACAIAPSSVLAQVSLGNALRAAGEVERSVEVLQHTADMAPAQAATKVHLGVALRAADRPQEAVEAFDNAEGAGHNVPHLLDNRAAAWLDLGEVDKARADYDALVARFPAYMQGHRARARLYWEYGLEGDPFESYAALARLHPREQTIWDAWIGNLLSYRQYQRAAETVERAEAAAGSHPLRTMMKAVALSELGRIDEANPAFEACTAALGGQVPFLNAHARHLLKRGDAARAAAVAERAVEIDPHSQFSWAYLGTAWRMLDDPREFWLHDYEGHVSQSAVRPADSAQDETAFAEEMAATLRALHKARVHPADQSLRGGTQTEGALFDRREPALRRLKAALLDAVGRFVATLPDDAEHPFLGRKTREVDFSGSWSVRLMRHGFHINHVHDAGWISSAYYLALPPADPGEDEDAAHLQLGAPPDEMGLGLPPRRIVGPKVGTLVLFPSSMWHGTIPFTTQGERLTAAFDIVPVTDT